MRKLIFVYNADSGKLNLALDIAHKILSPSTYSCNLCAITFDTFSENEKWKAWREQSNDELVFLHKDEFESRHTERFDYPVVLDNTTDGMQAIIVAEQLNSLQDADDLIQLLNPPE